MIDPQPDPIEVLLSEGQSAFAQSDFSRAIAAWNQAASRLTPAQDHLAPELYENLGLAWLNLERPNAAIVAFKRALDGHPTARVQSAYYIVPALIQAGDLLEARSRLRRWKENFGYHAMTSLRKIDELLDGSEA